MAAEHIQRAKSTTLRSNAENVSLQSAEMSGGAGSGGTSRCPLERAASMPSRIHSSSSYGLTFIGPARRPVRPRRTPSTVTAPPSEVLVPPATDEVPADLGGGGNTNVKVGPEVVAAPKMIT